MEIIKDDQAWLEGSEDVKEGRLCRIECRFEGGHEMRREVPGGVIVRRKLWKVVKWKVNINEL